MEGDGCDPLSDGADCPGVCVVDGKPAVSAMVTSGLLRPTAVPLGHGPMAPPILERERRDTWERFER